MPRAIRQRQEKSSGRNLPKKENSGPDSPSPPATLYFGNGLAGKRGAGTQTVGQNSWVSASEHKLPVLGKNIPKGQRHLILKRLELAVNLHVGRMRFGGFERVQLDKLVGEILDGSL